MSKRYLFLIAAIVLAGAGIYFRASSAHSARQQADQIIVADTAGAGDVSTRIASLKAFTGNHLGSSVSFTLQSSFDRATAAATAAAAATNSNSQIYAAAQKACAGKSDSITQARCNAAYLAQHLTNIPTPAPVPAPKLSDYQYSFKAPFWTPDLAGALLLGAGAAALYSFMVGRRKAGR